MYTTFEFIFINELHQQKVIECNTSQYDMISLNIRKSIEGKLLPYCFVHSNPLLGQIIHPIGYYDDELNYIINSDYPKSIPYKNNLEEWVKEQTYKMQLTEIKSY